MSGIFEYHPQVDGGVDPIEAITRCIESGAGSLLADRGSRFRLFATREQAVRWLEGGAASAGPLHDGPAADNA